MQKIKSNCIEYTVSNLSPLKTKPPKNDYYYVLQDKPESWIHTSNNIYSVYNDSKNGITILPCIYKYNIKNKENYIGQQFLYLDFDLGYSIEEILEIGELYGFIPNYYYETLRSTKEHPRYRLAFFFDNFIKNSDEVKYYFFIFKKVFDKVIDKDAANPFQTMLGGNGVSKIINMTYRLSFTELNMNFKQYLKVNDADRNFSRTLERFAKKIPNLEQYMGIENYCESIKSDNYDQILDKYRTQNVVDHLNNNGHPICVRSRIKEL